MPRNPLIVQPSPHGWSMYDPDRDEPLTDGLVCSANDPYDLARYAIVDLDSPVTISRDPILVPSE